MTLDELIQSLKAFDVQVFCEQCIEETEDQFIILQRQQMNAGLLVSGDAIVPPYSPATAKRKGQNTPDLYDTGAFYEGIDLTVSTSTINLTSSVAYTQWIEKRYTPNVWGLDDDYAQQYIDGSLYPLVVEKMDALGFSVK